MQRPSAEFIDGLRADLGEAAIKDGAGDRDAARRALWPEAMVPALDGDLATAPPDVIVRPESTEQVARVITACAGAEVAVFPLGANHGVYGGARLPTGGVALDMRGLAQVRHIDPGTGLVVVEAGVTFEALERALAEHDLTLGLLPSSLRQATIGGALATRSAGQVIGRGGPLDARVVHLEAVTGDGEVRQSPTRSGPGVVGHWPRILLGSEGTLAVITAATLQAVKRPEARHFGAWMVPDLTAGLTVMRRAAQQGLTLGAIRLLDPVQTALSGVEGADAPGPLAAVTGALTAPGPVRDMALKAALKAPRLLNGAASLARQCLLVAVTEGDEIEAGASRDALQALARQVGAESLSDEVARSWYDDVGVMGEGGLEIGGVAFSDALEASTTWLKVSEVYAAVLEKLSPHVLISARFGEASRGGCTVAFTFTGAAGTPAEARRRYDLAWSGGLDALLEHAAAPVQHTGIGLARAGHLSGAHGEGRRWYEAIKAVCDPAGVLNPGNLLDV